MGRTSLGEVRPLPEMAWQRQREPVAADFSLWPPAGSVPFLGSFRAGKAAAGSAGVSLHVDLWLKFDFFSSYTRKHCLCPWLPFGLDQCLCLPVHPLQAARMMAGQLGQCPRQQHCSGQGSPSQRVPEGSRTQDGSQWLGSRARGQGQTYYVSSQRVGLHRGW